MTEHTDRLLGTIATASDQYLSGRASIEELQAIVESVASALESDVDQKILTAVRRLASEVETICFMSEEQQQPDRVRSEIAAFQETLRFAQDSS